jgi:DNA primase
MPSPVDVSGSLIERIKRAVPLTDYLGRLTRLVRMGKRLMALCPFHPDTHPSMAVYADQGACYCYANQCPAHRRLDVIDVASLVWHTSTRDAARLLAQEYGL